MKLLLVRLSSIGDIVLTSPVVRCLKTQRPADELHFLTKPAFSDILAANPYIDRLHLLEGPMSRQIRRLNEEGFDEVIDLHHNARTLRIKNGVAAQSYSFPKLNLEKWLMVNLKWNLLPDTHVVDRYMETVKHLKVTNDGKGLDYFIPDADRVDPGELPETHREGFIAMVIGATHFTKRMPEVRLKELCLKLDRPIVLLGGSPDQARGEQIASANPRLIFNACGKYPINGSADLIRQAILVITHDTGLMHVAAAFKKPILSIWGNTIPRFGMYPYYGRNTRARQDSRLVILENNHLSCRPCTKIGYDHCPKGHFRCMMDIPMDQMVSTAREKLIPQI